MILIFCTGIPFGKKQKDRFQVKIGTSLKGKSSCSVRQLLVTFLYFYFLSGLFSFLHCSHSVPSIGLDFTSEAPLPTSTRVKGKQFCSQSFLARDDQKQATLLLNLFSAFLVEQALQL